ncbi:MAG: LytTR family DNA-binding domain-containing protein [Bacteroidetes bacterium]|nr:LytTR family DNA-binding domain-containing protein [Bacteroidota bacterium]
MKYTAIVIDDERLARLTLLKDLESFPEIVILGEASSIYNAKLLIEKLNPDLLFLDIQLVDGTGFDLINNIEFSGKIIFITAFDEYAIRAFEINAVDYLLKPISIKRLKNAIDKLSVTDKQNTVSTSFKLNYKDRLMVMHKKSINFIKIDTIDSIYASREYSYIHTINGKEYLTSKSLGEWDARLPDEHFCRIHRSAIINFDFIIKIEHHMTGTASVFIQGLTEPLNISRNYFRKLKDRYCL